MEKKTKKKNIIKKPKKVKKLKAIVVAQVPKPETPNASEQVIAALISLQASEGWAIITKILNDNISYLEKAILEKVDPISQEGLTDAEIEILRIKRSLNIEVKNTPENYSNTVKETGEVPENYDPYFKTNQEIMEARNRESQGKES